MPADVRSNLIAELTAEFIEERVRQAPTAAFGVDDVRRALSVMLRDAGDAAVLKPSDETWITAWLDRHPFLLKSAAGPAAQWRPGFNKAALRRA